jgi:hypothetical protein
MNLILALNTEYFANLSTSNSTVGSSDLLALPKTFLSILALHYGKTAFVAVIANILAVIILVTKMKTSADLKKIYLINLAVADIFNYLAVPFNYIDVMYGYWKFT